MARAPRILSGPVSRLEPATVALSPLEEQRFGVRTSRVNDLAAGDVAHVLRACAELEVELLIARCPATDLAAAQSLEAAGAGLMDTLVYYARDLAKNPPPEDPAARAIRLVRPGEEDEVARVAAESFRGYLGHYHADPRLERAKCDEVYTSWSKSACLARDERSDVLVLASDQGIDAFATMRMNRTEEGEGVLFGVLPARRAAALDPVVALGRR